jgi:UDP-GlcNAc:undecaprenyl-phosphate GlcNAc-1-phosphate transferase
VSLTLRYGLAFGIALASSLALTPVAARLAHRTGVIDQPKENRFHSRATPYLGGLAIAGGLVVAAAATAGSRLQLIVVVLGAVALAGVGLVDDLRGVGPVVKVACETAAGLALWGVGIRAGVTHVPVLDLLITVCWVVAVTNAVNLLDNMDGVTAGVTAIAATGLFAIAASQGDFLVASLALVTAGVSLGFLRYNFPPASIFMGDAGSLLLGFLLASLGLKLDLVGTDDLARSVIPVLAIGVPLFDMALVIISRLRAGTPIHLGGTDHTAHRLAARGLSGRRVAVAAYAAQGATSLAAFLLWKAGDLAVLVAFALAGLATALLLSVFLRMQTGTTAAAPARSMEPGA